MIQKENLIWVDQGKEFYNKPFKKWLNNNDIEIQSRYNEGKSVAAAGCIRNIKNKIYKHMTAVSKNVYLNALDYIVDK